MFAAAGLSEATSQYIAMRALGEPDIFPVSDRGVRRALKNGHKSFSRVEVKQAAERWRPWGSYAAMYLWIAEAEGRGDKQDGDLA